MSSLRRTSPPPPALARRDPVQPSTSPPRGELHLSTTSPSISAHRDPTPRDASLSAADDGTIRLRIAGLGHYFELDAAPTITLGELKEEIERRIDLPAPYQRLV